MISAKDFKGTSRKLLYYKFLFDKGFGLTNYAKYFLVAIGLVIKQVSSIIYIGVAYSVLCFIIGWLWAKYGLAQAENDVTNAFNPFIKDTNQKLKLLSKNKKFK